MFYKDTLNNFSRRLQPKRLFLRQPSGYSGDPNMLMSTQDGAHGVDTIEGMHPTKGIAAINKMTSDYNLPLQMRDLKSQDKYLSQIINYGLCSNPYRQAGGVR